MSYILDVFLLSINSLFVDILRAKIKEIILVVITRKYLIFFDQMIFTTYYYNLTGIYNFYCVYFTLYLSGLKKLQWQILTMDEKYKELSPQYRNENIILIE